MDYTIYLEDVRRKLTKLLEEQKIADNYREKKVQVFFEEYPCALLGALSGIPMKDSIFNNVIISQPRFRSVDKDRQPDFLVVTYNSLQIFFNFIELEDPSKTVFLDSISEMPSSEFHRAFAQLRQWATFQNGEVEKYCDSLIDALSKDSYDSPQKKIRHYNYLLVYGFSEEVLSHSVKYNGILQDYCGEKKYHHCTYSRLLDNMQMGRYPLFSVKKLGKNGHYKALGFVPFENYVTYLWHSFHNIVNKQDVVYKSPWLTDEQKEKLANQMTEMDSRPSSDFRGGTLTIKNFGDIELP